MTSSQQDIYIINVEVFYSHDLNKKIVCIENFGC